MILSDFDGGSRLFGTRIVHLDAFDENNVWLKQDGQMHGVETCTQGSS